MAYDPNAIYQKTRQGGDVLFSFVCAGIAAGVVWTFGEPFWAERFGGAVPWWVYPLLFSRFVAVVAHVMGDDSSLQNATPSPDSRPSRDAARQDPDRHAPLQAWRYLSGG